MESYAWKIVSSKPCPFAGMAANINYQVSWVWLEQSLMFVCLFIEAHTMPCFGFLMKTVVRLHKDRGGDTARTAVPEWPQSYSWSVMLSSKSWGKKKGGRMSGAMPSLLIVMSPAFLAMNIFQLIGSSTLILCSALLARTAFALPKTQQAVFILTYKLFLFFLSNSLPPSQLGSELEAVQCRAAAGLNHSTTDFTALELSQEKPPSVPATHVPSPLWLQSWHAKIFLCQVNLSDFWLITATASLVTCFPWSTSSMIQISISNQMGRCRDADIALALLPAVDCKENKFG